jgi:phage-related protein
MKVGRKNIDEYDSIEHPNILNSTSNNDIYRRKQKKQRDIFQGIGRG